MEKTELTKQEQKTTINSISSKLQSTYVFPNVAKEVSDLIQENLNKDKYSSFTNPYDFASQINKDMFSISNDKHLGIKYNPKKIGSQKQTNKTTDSLNAQNKYIEKLKRENFGFKELKILDGNIGYLDLRSFSEVEYAGETAVSAMNFLSNSNAIIIDLRMNGGGEIEMIQLITSYLFGSKPVHLNDIYWRLTDTFEQSWTLPYVQGKRSPKTPVYILTSKRTFSAAEEFSYNLKNLKRATLIGETTGGGAHPGDIVNATDKFLIQIPSGRAINPITNTNWEGTGVTPHIEVDSAKAFDIAHIKALELLKEKCDDDQLMKYFEWNLSRIKALYETVIIDKTILESYLGTYGPRVISITNNTLYYQRGNRNKYELIPLSEHEFLLKGMPSFRIKFIVEKGKTVALEGNYDNGRSDKNLKE